MRGRAWSLVVIAAVAGCFDSDEVVQATAESSGTSDGGTTASTEPFVPSPASTITSAGELAGDPNVSCQDAIVCVVECIREVLNEGQNDPDASCIVDCTEMLTVDESYDLLQLGNCASENCEAEGFCNPPPAETTGGGSSSSTDEPPDDDSLLDPCLSCILSTMSNADADVCRAQHRQCR